MQFDLPAGLAVGPGITGGPSIEPPTASQITQRDKFNRYDRYLRGEAVRITMGGGFIEAAELAAIRGYGEQDAKANADILSSPDYKVCVTRCGNEHAVQCIVDCVEGYNPTAAKVLGCQILPDRLPY